MASARSYYNNANDDQHDPSIPVSTFDILTGRTKVEAVLESIAATRKKMSPEELGHMAGIGVLDQFRVAKAETNVRWWKDPALALSTSYAMLTVGVPALAFGAALGIDIAIFGGASTSLSQANKLYNLLAVGSLVFAVGMGIAPNYRKYLAPLMLTACLGASVVAADNPKFKDHFATLLPDTLNTTSNSANSEVRIAQNNITAIRARIKGEETQLNTGGVGGKPILGDNYKGNDEEGYRLEAQIKADYARVEDASKALGKAQATQDVADKTNPAQYLGRMIGALYIASWLAASQLVVARVIELGPTILRRQREKASQNSIKKLFVDHLENPDVEKREKLASAAVSDMLMRFNKVLTDAAAKSPAKLDYVEALFDGNSLEKMRRIGTQLVVDTLTPRKSWKQKLSGLGGRKRSPASNDNQDIAAAPPRQERPYAPSNNVPPPGLS